MDGLTPLEALELDVMRRAQLLAAGRKAHELNVKRTLQLIDRALDVGNRRRFMELCVLLRSCKAKVSRAPDTP